MAGFFDVISGSSTHISHSALALAPHTSIVRKLYEQDSHHFARIVQGIPSSWDSSIASTKRPSGIGAIAWSPCGRLIAIAWADSTIEVLGPVTLERLYTMRSPPGTRVLEFSPDSRLLLCCGLSVDAVTNYIVSWDVQTGSMVEVGRSEAQAKGCPSAVTSSADGQMIGVLYLEPTTPGRFTICVYDLHSSECVSSHSFEGLFAGIWSRGAFLGVAAILPTENTLMVQELALSPGHTNREDTLYHVPSIFEPSQPFLVLPTLNRLAFITGDTAAIWDLQTKGPLLWANNTSFKGSAMCSSPDGQFFACGTTGADIYLWKYSEDRYEFHQKLASSVLSPIPLFSPNNRSIITWDRSTIQLWPLEDSATPVPTDLPQTPTSPKHFIFEFSPDQNYAAFARLEGNTATVLNLRSGVPRLVVDAEMEIYGLKFHNGTFVVEGERRFIAWDLPTEDRTPNAGANVAGGHIQSVALTAGRAGGPQSTSISPDLCRVAHVGTSSGTRPVGSLNIYEVGTGRYVGGTVPTFNMPWFSPNGKEIWCGGEVDKKEGWEIVKSDGSPSVSLVPLTGDPPEEWPWRSSRGYSIVNDEWILNRKSKQLLWLPPHWRSDERGVRVWCGPFLALLHKTLPEPVILELEV